MPPILKVLLHFRNTLFFTTAVSYWTIHLKRPREHFCLTWLILVAWSCHCISACQYRPMTAYSFGPVVLFVLSALNCDYNSCVYMDVIITGLGIKWIWDFFGVALVCISVRVSFLISLSTLELSVSLCLCLLSVSLSLSASLSLSLSLRLSVCLSVCPACLSVFQ